VENNEFEEEKIRNFKGFNSKF